MHFILRFLYRTTVTIMVLLLIALVLVSIGLIRLSSPYKGYVEDSKLVDIPYGTRLVGIADLLHREGIIRHPRTFVLAMAIERRRGVIRAGEYEFNRPLSEMEVINKLLHGEVHFRQVTVPEGSNIFDIADILERDELTTREEFLAATTHVELVKDVAPNAVSLEGYLFPDTYKFEKHTTALEIVERMVERFRHFLTPEYRQAAQEQNLTVSQAVILASLIEKETGQPDERPLVSAVFHNRLDDRQRLECDPTVIYAALVSNSFRGKIYRSDIQTDSPYNTYLQVGLPIGAICNPGRASLDAAIRPAHVNYRYFVSDNNGHHIFSSTLEAHQNAVRAYRHAVSQGVALEPSHVPHAADPPGRSSPPKSR
ncbi:MAG: endolytic transglycosylase MltG [Acidobacteriia bacterium]|nr:endolytic transglycosylase MltG [Terriglobia bacterium]